MDGFVHYDRNPEEKSPITYMRNTADILLHGGKLKYRMWEPHASLNGVKSVAQFIHKLQSTHCMLYGGGAVV